MRLIFTLFALVLSTSALAQMPQRILFVSAEQTGRLQTGGLAHAVSGLAQAANEVGIEARILQPYYLKMEGDEPQATRQSIDVPLNWDNGAFRSGARFDVYQDSKGLVPTTFLRHRSRANQLNFFDNTSGAADEKYAPRAIIGESFGAFDKAAADWILQNYGPNDIVVLNDWNTGLIALHIAAAKKAGYPVPRVHFVVHNMGYHGGDGGFPIDLSRHLGLDPKDTKKITAWGKINYLQAGLVFSDTASTVSRTYAEETLVPGSAQAAGMEKPLNFKNARNRWTGILNGMINEEWDPRIARAHGLANTFSVNDLSGKLKGKVTMQREFGLPVRDLPVIALTSRMAHQKGFEYFAGVIEKMVARGDSQWVVVGDGDPEYVKRMQALERKYPERIRYMKFSKDLEARVTRYADFFMNAAWYEPCGLNQFFSLINGTIPIVSRVGGLADSIHHGVNGFSFDIVPGRNGALYDIKATQNNIVAAIDEAFELYRKPQLKMAMQKSGMREDNSWKRRFVEAYLPLFSFIMQEGYKRGPFKPEDYRLQVDTFLEGKPGFEKKADARPSTVAAARSRSGRRAATMTCSALFGR